MIAAISIQLRQEVAYAIEGGRFFADPSSVDVRMVGENIIVSYDFLGVEIERRQFLIPNENLGDRLDYIRREFPVGWQDPII